MMLTLARLAWQPVGAVVRRSDAQAAHDATIALLRAADGVPAAVRIARRIGRATMPPRPTSVGGVVLPHPLIVAAGLVKGDGFPDEAAALGAVQLGRDVIPGWRSVPALLGAVELGSFTRHPRLGEPGRVVWRDARARSMENRIGLRNPGAVAAAEMLVAQGRRLPRTWGVSLAASPGLADPGRAAGELDEAAAAFVARFAGHPRPPAWYTLNLSCPNTEDDPEALQTGALARTLASALVGRAGTTPVWVKVGPGLSSGQYRTLVAELAACGVRAIVATNTLPRTRHADGRAAGVSGAPVRDPALAAVAELSRAIRDGGHDLDVVGCGGILIGRDLVAFEQAGASAAMLYSALVFRGPLAPALILREADAARAGQRAAPAPARRRAHPERDERAARAHA